MRYTDNIVIVTGAGHGIGRAGLRRVITLSYVPKIMNSILRLA